MSLNLTVVVIRDTTLDELGVIDPTVMDFDTVYSAPGDLVLSATQVGAHVVAVDPLHGELASAVTAGLGRQVYTMTLGGVADVYVIQAHGPVARLVVRQAGEVVEDVGLPLPAESALAREEFLEDAHLAVLSALMDAPFAVLWDAPFVALATR